MVEVFRLNIDTEKKARFVLKCLQDVFPNFSSNFDLEDCDNILRVENQGGKIDAGPIVSLIEGYGYKIEVLPDIPAVNPVSNK